MRKLRKVIIYDDYNSKIVKGGIIGTLTPQFGNPSARHGTKLIELYERIPDSINQREKSEQPFGEEGE